MTKQKSSINLLYHRTVDSRMYTTGYQKTEKGHLFC